MTPFLAEHTVDRYVAQLNDWIRSIQDMTDLPVGQETDSLLGAALSRGQARTPGLPSSRPVRPLTSALSVAPAVLAGLLLMLGAVVAVLVAIYVPDPAFGAPLDRFQLLAAAFGSAQSAAILALLLSLRTAPAWRPGS